MASSISARGTLGVIRLFPCLKICTAPLPAHNLLQILVMTYTELDMNAKGTDLWEHIAKSRPADREMAVQYFMALVRNCHDAATAKRAQQQAMVIYKTFGAALPEAYNWAVMAMLTQARHVKVSQYAPSKIGGGPVPRPPPVLSGQRARQDLRSAPTSSPDPRKHRCTFHPLKLLSFSRFCSPPNFRQRENPLGCFTCSQSACSQSELMKKL